MAMENKKPRKKAESRAGRGRPTRDEHLVTLSVRLQREMIEQLDGWCKKNGGVDRANAIRLLLAKQLRAQAEIDA